MMPHVMIKANNMPVAGYKKIYKQREAIAITRAGFEQHELAIGMFGIEDAPDIDLTGRMVFTRHYANQHTYIANYIVNRGGKLAVPGYWTAADWYKSLPISPNDEFFSRDIAWYSLREFGYLEEKSELQALHKLIDNVFEKYAVQDKLFVKSETKNSFTAKVYTKGELEELLLFLLGVGCHRTPGEIIVSTPMDIKTSDAGYDREEYRCLIVRGKCSTASIFTDEPSQRNYTEVVKFTNSFAKKFAAHLPNTYDLDIARLTDGRLIVVELNDIAACGFFADNDLNKLFTDLYNLY